MESRLTFHGPALSLAENGSAIDKPTHSGKRVPRWRITDMSCPASESRVRKRKAPLHGAFSFFESPE
jgi:hypothetical protein